MAYRLKPGKLERKAMAAYNKVQQSFVSRFLEEDPNSPSGYALRNRRDRPQGRRRLPGGRGPRRRRIQEGRNGLCRRFFGRNRPFAKDGGGATATGENHEKE